MEKLIDVKKAWQDMSWKDFVLPLFITLGVVLISKSGSLQAVGFPVLFMSLARLVAKFLSLQKAIEKLQEEPEHQKSRVL